MRMRIKVTKSAWVVGALGWSIDGVFGVAFKSV